MANELQSLSQLFHNKLFRIPDYQRGYAWLQPQLVDFWDDLINLQTNRYHYTGLLSLKKLKRPDIKSWGSDLWLVEKGYTPYHIVDGQQRLTTFIILLNEIVSFVRSLPENNSKNDKDIVLGYETLSEIVDQYISRKRPPNGMVTTYFFGYESDNPSAEYLKYKVFCEPYGRIIKETYYTKNLKFAKSFFADNIANLYQTDGIDGISLLYRKLTLNLMFNTHEIKDDYDVFIAFETMNNRGKKLTNLELLKNRLIYLTTIYSDDIFDTRDKDELRKQINDAWKEVYFQLGRNKNTPLSDDEFLRAHWIIYFAYSRKKGDDYIQFLLRKFSAKNIFEKKTVITESVPSHELDETDFEEDDGDDSIISDISMASKLKPTEIRDYVNSLMSMAKYWYDTYFPYESQILTSEEKLWIDRLNRIGIGHFRPFVTAILSKSNVSSEERIRALKAIERFIFVCFRLGNFNASYQSSEYYRAARSTYFDELNLEQITKNLNQIVDDNIKYALPHFTNRIEKCFNSGDGYYSWKPIKYFMYEYEYSLAEKNGINKISWELFTKTEKDKISIEHILPQTPSKFYWKNQFRQFCDEEIKQLSGALGNLLLLSQSVNSGLQNDSFEDKKHSKSNGRRGYENGSHSEIEVSKEPDWDAKIIYKRSKDLLKFMSKRWNIPFAEGDLEKLAFVSFVNDNRNIPEELSLTVATEKNSDSEKFSNSNDIKNNYFNFWSGFVNYCNINGRNNDIARRKAYDRYWYDIAVGTPDYHISFTITRNKYLTLLVYVYNMDTFRRLESKKEIIEIHFGNKLDWYSSKNNSKAKRILYKRKAEFYNQEKYDENFQWMIDAFDRLHKALKIAGE
ncbi:MAG: DUF4268 domain-containing protein [Alphaproteobacteria bacterium]|nr:DUF4268 domain-containing protein [Alphaproteobacteria bacterium]